MSEHMGVEVAPAELSMKGGRAGATGQARLDLTWGQAAEVQVWG